jgi:hypothetical protein
MAPMLDLLHRAVDLLERIAVGVEQIAAHHQAGPELATLQQLHVLNRTIGADHFNAARLHELTQATHRRALRVAFPGSPRSIGKTLAKLAEAGHLVNVGTADRPLYAICRFETDKTASVNPWHLLNR